MEIEIFCFLMLADSSVNGNGIPHYIYVFVEQGLFGGGQARRERGDILLWFFK